jgi:hypothetical protein
MTTVFQDLKNGLGEVDAFLSGETSGYKVSVPKDRGAKAIESRPIATRIQLRNSGE